MPEIVSRLTVRKGPYDAADGALFANAGTGFHSNDARSIVLHRDAALPRATGNELGLRHSWNTGSVSAAGWLLDLQSETVWVGDEGTTEPSGATRRLGIVDWNEAQFAMTSRLRGEVLEVTELHFTPGSPLSIQLGVRVRLN